MAYDPTEAGNRAVHAIAYSDGSNKILDIFGTAGSQPKVLVEFQSIDGQSWIPFTPGKNFIFGDELPITGHLQQHHYGIVGAVNNIDLAEGQVISAGQSQTATLFCAVPERQVNTPSFSGYA
ncbi:hypothetical protein C1H76_0607 [Elsinoe australis]|uniref:Uncharacterized protein n=1 Tax=Elsinoe australis TaxID=40998 RepID=A0A4U7B6Q0_9PEZI|nr:hypothetical protein C1H76_0607 [Elsinoe australis]